ncbi:hypothetical protein L2E82_02409 [Cichorium intybus]|uniref:Uncharacterized protein n=1 Tax=Cichorium intybus TaxID=13427 RepID=A0ACB9H174_CICIN|nr:hypothetical protein L2E82_02409 [Cichorium intybus]
MKSLHFVKRCVLSTAMASIVSLFLFATCFNLSNVSSLYETNSFFSSFNISSVKTAMNFAKENNQSTPPPPPSLPRFAYLVSGSKGDLNKLWRTLQALYHPWNYYVLHLDLESPPQERMELVSRVENDPVFAAVGNVYVILKANMVTYTGPTMVSNTLHACAILLKRNKDWDWFINLSASDYPLVTQDDLIFAFRDLNRDLNFIEHTSNLGWKMNKRAMPLMVDPGLYQNKKSNILWVEPKRELPTSFKLFTVVNHDMHYISWDTPPKQHPRVITINDTTKMTASGVPFARKFKQDTLVLDRIDEELLHRPNGSFTPGGWCKGDPKCTKVGPTQIEPGVGGQRLSQFISKLLEQPKFNESQCR